MLPHVEGRRLWYFEQVRKYASKTLNGSTEAVFRFRRGTYLLGHRRIKRELYFGFTLNHKENLKLGKLAHWPVMRMATMFSQSLMRN